MPSVESLLAAGLAALERADPAGAEETFAALGRTHAANKPAVLQAADALRVQGQPESAAAVLRAALEVQPDSAAFLDALADAYAQAGRAPQEAETREYLVRWYRERLSRGPAHADIWADLGKVLGKLGRWDEAEAAHRSALSADADHAGAALNLGTLLMTQSRMAEAQPLLQRARALVPGNALAHLNAARVELQLMNLEASIAAAAAAASLVPNLAEAHQLLGAALLEAGRPAEAVPSLRTAAAQRPESSAALINLAKAEVALGHDEAAATLLERVLAMDPANAGARAMLNPGVESEASVTALLQRAWSADTMHAHGEARQHYADVLKLSPGHVFALSRLLTLDGIEGRLEDARDRHRALVANLEQANLAAMSWMHLALIAYQAVLRPMPHALYRSVAAAIDRQLADTSQAPLHSSRGEGRIRIGYLSSLLRDHPVGHVTANLFAAHDRSRFEVHVFYLPDGPETPFTRIVAAGAEHFITLPAAPEDMAAAIAARDIDILVYLDGYMSLALLPVVAARPARAQAFWLGHAGSCDISAIDYVIADATVVPPGEENLYRADVLRLAGTYHCASPHPIGAPMTRAEAGLPEEGFVFCAFNNPEKIETVIFESWMRILARVEGSVLWVSQTLTPAVETNLRASAVRHGVDGARLIFAGRLPDKARHLARHYLCGLFLDTLTLNASTTALDALWAGLPVLTVAGARFGARIAESFLRTAGLADMIVPDLAAYEDRAVHLATHPDALVATHERLAENLETKPLFKIDVFCRALEASFASIYQSTAKAGKI